MKNFKFIYITKILNFSNTKGNTLNNSTSRLLNTQSQNSKVRAKTKNSFVMAFRKLKHCLSVRNVQHLVAICILFANLDPISADARKFQPNSDITTNIITDPKSAASIDFR